MVLRKITEVVVCDTPGTSSIVDFRSVSERALRACGKIRALWDKCSRHCFWTICANWWMQTVLCTVIVYKLGCNIVSATKTRILLFRHRIWYSIRRTMPANFKMSPFICNTTWSHFVLEWRRKKILISSLVVTCVKVHSSYLHKGSRKPNYCSLITIHDPNGFSWHFLHYDFVRLFEKWQWPNDPVHQTGLTVFFSESENEVVRWCIPLVLVFPKVADAHVYIYISLFIYLYTWYFLWPKHPKHVHMYAM